MMKLFRKLTGHRDKPVAAVEAGTIDRREFLEKGLIGAAVITSTWLAADQLYENYGSPLDEVWLDAYYKSDFIGV